VSLVIELLACCAILYRCLALYWKLTVICIEEIFFGTVTFTEVNHSTGVIGEVKEEEDTGGSIS